MGFEPMTSASQQLYLENNISLQTQGIKLSNYPLSHPPPPASISPSKLSPCQDLRWSYPPFTCGFGNDLVKVSSLVACIQIKALQLSTNKTTQKNYKGYLFQFSCFFLWHQHGKKLNQLCRWSQKKYFTEILKDSKGSSKLFLSLFFLRRKWNVNFSQLDPARHVNC